MRKHMLSAILIFLSVLFVSQVVAKTTVAYVDLSNSYASISERVTAAMLEKITNGGRYNLVTRNNANLDFISNERNLFTSGLSSGGAEKLKLLGASYLLVFKMINSNYDTHSYTNDKGETTNYVDVHVNGLFVIISVSNGQILKALSLQETGSQPYGQLGSSYVSYNGAYNNAQNSAIGQCANDMNRTLNSLAKIYAVVIEKVAKDQLLIDQGNSAGIRVGDELKFVSTEYGVEDYSGEAKVIKEGANRAIIKVSKTPDFPITLNETKVFVITNPPPNPFFTIMAGVFLIILVVVYYLFGTH